MCRSSEELGLDLISLIRAQEWEQVEKILSEENVNVNVTDENQDTPLTFAAFYGHLETVQALLDKKADVTHKNKFGNTPLREAIGHFKWDVASLLISPHINLNWFSSEGYTPLMNAIRFRRWDIAASLINNKANIYAEHPIHKDTALTCAVDMGHYKTVELLVEADAENGKPTLINQINNYDGSPLNYAIKNNYDDIANLLINNRANVNCVATNQESALMFAVKKNNLAMVEKLIENQANINHESSQCRTTPLILAIRNKNENISKYLLNAKAEVNSSDNSSALMGAVYWSNFNMVKELIDRGADINYKSEFNYNTPLITSLRLGGRIETDIVELLINRGADVNHVNDQEDSALALAIYKKKLGIVKLLLDKKANVNCINKDKDSALTLAARVGDLNIVKLLLDKKADVNYINGNQDSPLTLAIHDLEITKLLLDRKANVNHVKKDEDSALTLSICTGNLEIIKFLLDKKADVNENKGSALISAIYWGKAEVVKLLLDKKADVNYIKEDNTTRLNISHLHNSEIYNLLLSYHPGISMINSQAHLFPQPSTATNQGNQTAEMGDQEVNQRRKLSS